MYTYRVENNSWTSDQFLLNFLCFKSSTKILQNNNFNLRFLLLNQVNFFLVFFIFSMGNFVKLFHNDRLVEKKLKTFRDSLIPVKKDFCDSKNKIFLINF